MGKKVNLQDLRNAVEAIEIRETMQREIIRNVEERTEKNRGGVKIAPARRIAHRIPRVAAAAAAAGVLLAVCVIGIPVRALVSSLVKERMEEIPAKEHEATAEMLDSQPAGADSYSREYSADERRRMKELWGRYQEGEFPEGELPQAGSAEEAGNYELWYLTTDSSFHLPDRELTDEELLELIDFEVKRNYALQKRYEEEYADEIEADRQAREEAAIQAAEAGGITEEEAVASAKAWLQKLYGITGDGMEQNSYFEETQDAGYAGSGEKDTYMVNWSDVSGRQYYYFYISAQDGSLVYASYSGSDLADAREKPVTPEEAEEKLPELKAKAEAFLKDKLGADAAAYGESYAYYITYTPAGEDVQTGEESAGSQAAFLFCPGGGRTAPAQDALGSQAAAAAAQPAYGYVISYAWDGTFSECCRVKNIDTYWDNRDMLAQSYRKNHGVEVRQVRVRLDEIE